MARPFGWVRSVLWFAKLLRPVVRYLREKYHYRVLPYIDDFLLSPSPGYSISHQGGLRARSPPPRGAPRAIGYRSPPFEGVLRKNAAARPSAGSNGNCNHEGVHFGKKASQGSTFGEGSPVAVSEEPLLRPLGRAEAFLRGRCLCHPCGRSFASILGLSSSTWLWRSVRSEVSVRREVLSRALLAPS